MSALPEDGLALTLLADVRASGLLGTRPIALTLLHPPYPALGVGALRVLRVSDGQDTTDVVASYERYERIEKRRA
jgi:hypothetical protein